MTACPVCGNGITTRGQTYCSALCAIDASTPARRQRTHVETTAQRGYDHEWRKIRLDVLQDDEWQCQMPIDEHGLYDPTEQGPPCMAYANTVDHIIEVTIDPTLRLERTNLRAACKSHNSSKAAHNTNAKRMTTT